MVEDFRKVQGFVEDGELLDAIELLQRVAENRDTKIARELSGLRGRLSSVDDDELRGVVTSADASVERQKIREYFLTRLGKLKQGPLSEKELKARREYLAAFKIDVTNRFNESIHNARLMDLGLADTPSAVRLPWIYKNTATQQSFASLDEAFESYGRRLLVLGAPGSGKTVTLLHIAKRLLAEAENDPSAPIPVLANLSKLDLKESSRGARWPIGGLQEEPVNQSKHIERWLQKELAANPFVSPDMAGRWIREKRVAALLDGLDEVDDSYRASVAKLLNDTYLREHPSSVVVVCSRINEYKPIQEKKEWRLNLGGSVTLQPFSDAQIFEYLELSKAAGLKETLLNDPTLYQIAQTPLMLSMLTLAYAGVEINQVPSSGSPIERRHQLMERYVERMLQRKMRRDRGIVVDNNPDNDISEKEYPFSPDRLNHYLGWLAVRLSVRMQTAFSTPRLCSFLQREIGRDRWFGVWWAGVFARAPLLAAFTLCGGLALAPMERSAWQLVAGLGLSGMLLYVLTAWSFRSNKNAWNTGASPSVVPKAIKPAPGVTVIAAAVAGGLCVGSLALASVLPGNIPPIVAGTIGVCLAVLVMLIVGETTGTGIAEAKMFIAGTAAVIGLGILWRFTGMPVISGGPDMAWYAFAAVLAGFQISFLGIEIAREENWWTGLAVVAGIVSMLAVGYKLIELLEPLVWYQPLAVFLLISLSVLCVHGKPFLFLAGGLAAFVLGAAIQQVIGAAIAMVAYGVVVLVISAIEPVSGYSSEKPGVVSAWKQAWVPRTVDVAEDFAERYWISPTLFPVLATMRSLPVRFRPFANYAIDSLLLKRSGPDIEFMHRMLRDYFALRDLQPFLRSNDLPSRVQAIRSLGYQGDAAIGALAEFVRDMDPDIRDAAVWALGRIASPEIVQHVEAALTDKVARVRATAALSTKDMPDFDQYRLLRLVANDDDLAVQRAMIELFLESKNPHEDAARRALTFREELREAVWEVIRSGSLGRWKAIRVAAELRDSKALPALIAVLQGGDRDAASAAAAALGEIRDIKAAKALSKAVNSNDKNVRDSARAALAALGVGTVEDVPRGIFRFFGRP
ncbi:HEAT repeat domain-containing protein [Bradyrhizobium sp. AZCC 2262]|uniref:HEAT repeat domain-containing protein n=1 Tax=Bradyrhizobium sp. AZCC 2262 TaxID=3117022 RepID=UPI002FEF4DB5